MIRGRVIILVLTLIFGTVVALIDSAPVWSLVALAALAWGVYLVFLTASLRRTAPQPCSCPTCRRVEVKS